MSGRLSHLLKKTMAKQEKNTKKGFYKVGPPQSLELNSDIPIEDQIEAQSRKFKDRLKLDRKNVTRSVIKTVEDNVRNSNESLSWLLDYLANDAKELNEEMRKVYQLPGEKIIWRAVNLRELSTALQMRHEGSGDGRVMAELRRLFDTKMRVTVRYLDKNGKIQTAHIYDHPFIYWTDKKDQIVAIGVKKRFVDLCLLDENNDKTERLDYVKTYTIKQVDGLPGTPIVRRGRRILLSRLRGLIPNTDYKFNKRDLWSKMFPYQFEQRRESEMEEAWNAIVCDMFTIGLLDNLFSYQEELFGDIVCFRISGSVGFERLRKKRKRKN